MYKTIDIGCGNVPTNWVSGADLVEWTWDYPTIADHAEVPLGAVEIWIHQRDHENLYADIRECPSDTYSAVYMNYSLHYLTEGTDEPEVDQAYREEFAAHLRRITLPHCKVYIRDYAPAPDIDWLLDGGWRMASIFVSRAVAIVLERIERIERAPQS